MLDTYIADDMKFLIKNILQRAVVPTALGTVFLIQPAVTAPSFAHSGNDPFAVLDSQNWVNPDNMTWADWKAPPGTNWADSSKRGSNRKVYERAGSIVRSIC